MTHPIGNVFSRRALLLGGSVLASVGSLVVAASIPAVTDRQPASQSPGTPSAGTPGTPGVATPGLATPGAATVVHVSMTSALTFDPSVVAIRVGDTVVWTNDSPMPHTATGDPAQNPLGKSRPEFVQLPDGASPWGSDLLGAGSDYTHLFSEPGTYHYICVPHVLSGMRGRVVVSG